MGSPSNYLNDDLSIVEELQVGQGEVFVQSINYLFEGKNFIQMAYGKARDSEFAEFSWPHGDKKVNPKIFNLTNSLSRVLTPGWVFNESK